jgi:hypothetical protein
VRGHVPLSRDPSFVTRRVSRLDSSLFTRYFFVEGLSFFTHNLLEIHMFLRGGADPSLSSR